MFWRARRQLSWLHLGGVDGGAAVFEEVAVVVGLGEDGDVDGDVVRVGLATGVVEGTIGGVGLLLVGVVVGGEAVGTCLEGSWLGGGEVDVVGLMGAGDGEDEEGSGFAVDELTNP